MERIIKFIRNKLVFLLAVPVALVIFAGVRPVDIKAQEASPVSMIAIDYEDLNLYLSCGGNTAFSISKDGKTWEDYELDISSDKAVMDISWINSGSEYTLYIKGNLDDTPLELVIPQKNTSFKVKFDKASDDFEFDETGDADSFEWRKNSNDTWYTVSFDTSSVSYKAFIAKIETFRSKGIKLVFRTPSVPGTDASDMGSRPSKEVNVSIPKRDAAPSLSVNVKKGLVNTLDTMEYYNTSKGTWESCEKAMSVYELAPLAAYKNGGYDVSVDVRVAATDSKGYSKTATLLIKGQQAAPKAGGSDAEVTFYTADGKFYLQLPKADKANIYEIYADTKGDFDPETAAWKVVKSSKAISFTKNKVAAGTKIYIRRAGVSGSSKKGTSTVLPSETIVVTVSY